MTDSTTARRADAAAFLDADDPSAVRAAASPAAPGTSTSPSTGTSADPSTGPSPHPSTGTSADPSTGSPAGMATAQPPFDAERRAMELAILDALRSVVDPEIGMNVVELALIKQIILGEESAEIKMILTTPFCPYAGSLIAQVKEAAESVVERPVKITLLAERWDPRDAGLMW